MKPANKICRKELGYLLLYFILGSIALFPIAILFLAFYGISSDIGLSEDVFESAVGGHILIWIQDIVLIFLPAYLWCKHRLRRDPLTCYGLRTFDWRWVLLASCACMAFIFTMDPIATFLSNLPYPDAIQDYLNQEKVEDFAMSQKMMNLSGIGGFIECVLLVSLSAAFTEEIFFRGALLKGLGLSTLNPHAVAIIVGIVFSAVHMQVNGSIDRALFGIFACYLVYWSRSLWPSIAMHAINNFVCILQFRALPEDFDPLAPAKLYFPWYVSVAGAVALFFLIRKMYEMREVPVTIPSVEFSYTPSEESTEEETESEDSINEKE